MPIRPENRHRYPDNWGEIREAIMRRADLRCECLGECGRGHRERCVEIHGHRSQWGARDHRIVLTIAHLNHTPEDSRPEVLKAMCQGCHLHYDRPHHEQSVILNRQAAIESAGQAQLFEPVVVQIPVTPVDHPAAPAGVVMPVDDWLEGLYSIASLRDDIREDLLEAVAERRLLTGEVERNRARTASAVTAAVQSGAQRNELAAALGVTKPTIYRLLEEHAATRKELEHGHHARR